MGIAIAIQFCNVLGIALSAMAMVRFAHRIAAVPAIVPFAPTLMLGVDRSIDRLGRGSDDAELEHGITVDGRPAEALAGKAFFCAIGAAAFELQAADLVGGSECLYRSLICQPEALNEGRENLRMGYG